MKPRNAGQSFTEQLAKNPAASTAAVRKTLKRRLLRITLIASNLCQVAKQHAIHARLPLK
jgi:hypothetical protein